ncbi:MAG TPA: GTPase, partial [Planctomycetota bacterium]|nr:GTPase [Planctomycetota bacterium]
FNRLLARDAAIVTAVDGTTRDGLEEELDLVDVRLLLVDTAGEKAPAEELDDLALERARIERTRAELLLVVVDASRPLTALDATLLEACSAAPALVVLNKCDLPVDVETGRTVRARGRAVSVSCRTGSGLDRLRGEVREALTHGHVREGGQRFLFNLRQLDSLRGASDALARATDAARENAGFEFTAAEIRAAVNRLRELTHPLDEDEILERVFSRFCIGK